MERSAVEEDPKFKLFVNTRNISKITITKYIERIVNYCTYTNKTPSELIENARKDQIEKPWLDDREITYYFTNYYHYLRDEKNRSYETIKNNIHTVKSFYKRYGIQLPEIKLENRRERARRRKKKLPTKNDIKLAMNNTSLKYKTIILLMSSSGMGNGEIRSLQYKHFINAISYFYKPSQKERYDIGGIIEKLQRIEEPLILQWDIERGKTGEKYTTFSSPESTEILLIYLDFIVNDITLLNDDYYLFGRNGVILGDKSIPNTFANINEKCDFGKHGYQNVLKSHNMRKCFQTFSRKSGVSLDYIKLMSGQVGDELAERYQDITPEMLFNEYISALDELSIEKVETITIKSPEFVKLEDRLNQVEEQHRKEMDELKRNLKMREELK
jgi:integrase